MERIVIEVDDATAKRWRYSRPEIKQKVATLLKETMTEAYLNDKDAFWAKLEAMRIKAEEEGFNDEILNEILKDE
jgi:hypothetical protein